MSNLRSPQEVKYELLLHTYNTRPKLQFKEYCIILTSIGTIFLVTFLTLCLTWGTIIRERSDTLDFSLYGPSKSSMEYMTVQQIRAEYYANITSQQINQGKNEATPAPPEPEVFHSPHDTAAQRNNYKLICYYSIPSGSNINSTTDLLPEGINATLCTHINLAFAGIANNNITPLSAGDEKMYGRVLKLKEQNPSLKILISVNGNMSSLIKTHTTRKQFIRGVFAFLRQYSLDGLDLDWEFPQTREHRRNFAILIAELREKFSDKYLLTVAVAAPEPIVLMAYDIGELSRFVDWVNVMTYDFHFYTKYTPFTGANAPLFPSQKDRGYFVQLNTNWSINFWESNGMPKSKIAVGMPTYGHTFTLVNPENNGYGAPARGFGSLGSNGFTSYTEVCQFIANGAKVVQDWDTRVPYAFNLSDWVSYDDVLSLSYKADLIRKNGYAGAMVWNLNSDDYNGLCSQDERKLGQRFPLISHIKDVLLDDEL